jgi:hypothetical protein
MSTENPQPVSRKMIAKKSKNLEPPSLVCQNNVMKRKLACNSFIDAGIVNSGKSIVYYRLLTSDKDGKFENSNIISLKLRGNSQWNVRLLSNPVQDNVNVILSGITGNVQLSINDINGKTIYIKSLQNTNGQISLPVVLQKGVYILEAETNNERKSVKFVK